MSDKNEKFWSKLTPSLVKEHVPEGYTFYNSACQRPSFFIVESGLVTSVWMIEDGSNHLRSNILPMTAFGDLFQKGAGFGNTYYTAITDSIIWKLPESKLQEMLKTTYGASLHKELLQIEAKLLRERFDTMVTNLILSE